MRGIIILVGSAPKIFFYFWLWASACSWNRSGGWMSSPWSCGWRIGRSGRFPQPMSLLWHFLAFCSWRSLSTTLRSLVTLGVLVSHISVGDAGKTVSAEVAGIQPWNQIVDRSSTKWGFQGQLACKLHHLCFSPTSSRFPFFCELFRTSQKATQFYEDTLPAQVICSFPNKDQNQTSLMFIILFPY